MHFGSQKKINHVLLNNYLFCKVTGVYYTPPADLRLLGDRLETSISISPHINTNFESHSEFEFHHTEWLICLGTYQNAVWQLYGV